MMIEKGATLQQFTDLSRIDTILCFPNLQDIRHQRPTIGVSIYM